MAAPNLHARVRTCPSAHLSDLGRSHIGREARRGHEQRRRMAAVSKRVSVAAGAVTASAFAARRVAVAPQPRDCAWRREGMRRRARGSAWESVW